jgi:hypothetical protein
MTPANPTHDPTRTTLAGTFVTQRTARTDAGPVRRLAVRDAEGVLRDVVLVPGRADLLLSLSTGGTYAFRDVVRCPPGEPADCDCPACGTGLRRRTPLDAVEGVAAVLPSPWTDPVLVVDARATVAAVPSLDAGPRAGDPLPGEPTDGEAGDRHGSAVASDEGWTADASGVVCPACDRGVAVDAAADADRGRSR